MIKFNVLNRWPGEVQFTSEIDCEEGATAEVKLGLSVKWAINIGASLDGARLVGASLDDASLDGARLDGANLIIGGQRSDGYRFLAFRERDGAVKIRAGCRYFSIEEARAHWLATREKTRLGDESFALVDDLERRARIAGWFEAVAKVAAE